MDTKIEIKSQTAVEVEVSTDILTEVENLHTVELFTEERYQYLNRNSYYNSTMLPGPKLVLMPSKLHDKIHDYASDMWSDNRMADSCDAVYDEVLDHKVSCALPMNHEGPHIHMGCFDINAIWR